jgi:ATP-dependent Zn protease
VPIESSARDTSAVSSHDTIREIINNKVTDSVKTTTVIYQVVDTTGRQLSKQTTITREIYHNELDVVMRLQHTIDSLRAVKTESKQTPVQIETRTKVSIWSTLIPYIINLIILAMFALYLWRKKKKQPP